jgi:hypothetical protein
MEEEEEDSPVSCVNRGGEEAASGRRQGGGCTCVCVMRIGACYGWVMRVFGLIGRASFGFLFLRGIQRAFIQLKPIQSNQLED